MPGPLPGGTGAAWVACDAPSKCLDMFWGSGVKNPEGGLPSPCPSRVPVWPLTLLDVARKCLCFAPPLSWPLVGYAFLKISSYCTAYWRPLPPSASSSPGPSIPNPCEKGGVQITFIKLIN